MANLTISIDPALIPRIQAAFSHENDTGAIVPATAAEVQQAIKDYLHGRVVAYETQQVAAAKTQAVQGETW